MKAQAEKDQKGGNKPEDKLKKALGGVGFKQTTTDMLRRHGISTVKDLKLLDDITMDQVRLCSVRQAYRLSLACCIGVASWPRGRVAAFRSGCGRRRAGAGANGTAPPLACAKSSVLSPSTLPSLPSSSLPYPARSP